MAFHDPEQLHGKLTSGNADGIADVATALSRAKSSLQSAANTISDGALSAREGWAGKAATEFLGKARESSTAAADVYRRLQAAERAIGRAALAYAAMEKAADAAIRPWRAEQASLSDDERRELGMIVTRNLMQVRKAYETQLGSAAVGLRRETDTGGGGSGGWDSDGNAHISGVGDEQPWTSQGLAYDGKNLLVTSYYDGNGEEEGTGEIPEGHPTSRVTYVDEATGKEQRDVYLGGKGSGEAPSHSGGIATDGEHVWIADTGQIYVYDKADLDNYQPGDPPVPAKEVVDAPDGSAASYVTYAKGKDGKPKLYVGDYGNNQLYELNVNGDGKPDRDTYPDPVQTPNNAQGVLVRDDEFIFSNSDGHDGKLVRQDRDWDGDENFWDPSEWDNRDDLDLDGDQPGNDDGYDSHGVEELVEIDGEIVLAHESGADGYGGNPGEKWDEPELTRIPLDELGLDADGALSPGDAGYDADPDTLTGAASTLDEATSTLQATASALSGLQVMPSMLGEVPAAARFAEASTRYITATGSTVQSGSDVVGDIADSLISGANTYRRLEDAASSTLQKLGDVFG